MLFNVEYKVDEKRLSTLADSPTEDGAKAFAAILLKGWFPKATPVVTGASLVPLCAWKGFQIGGRCTNGPTCPCQVAAVGGAA